jgi:hypothetical protein
LGELFHPRPPKTRRSRNREAPTAPKSGNAIHAGLQALIDAGMTHISVEQLVLTERFRVLFTREELAEAELRLAAIPRHALHQPVPAEENHPETLSERREYFWKTEISVHVFANSLFRSVPGLSALHRTVLSPLRYAKAVAEQGRYTPLEKTGCPYPIIRR